MFSSCLYNLKRLGLTGRHDTVGEKLLKSYSMLRYAIPFSHQTHHTYGLPSWLCSMLSCDRSQPKTANIWLA